MLHRVHPCTCRQIFLFLLLVGTQPPQRQVMELDRFRVCVWSILAHRRAHQRDFIVFDDSKHLGLVASVIATVSDASLRKLEACAQVRRSDKVITGSLKAICSTSFSRSRLIARWLDSKPRHACDDPNESFTLSAIELKHIPSLVEVQTSTKLAASASCCFNACCRSSHGR